MREAIILPEAWIEKIETRTAVQVQFWRLPKKIEDNSECPAAELEPYLQHESLYSGDFGSIYEH